VLNDAGDFVGFDVVIGNPPYGVKFSNEEKKYFKLKFESIVGKYDSYGFFIELGLRILGINKRMGFIIPHTWTTVVEAQTLRDLLIREVTIEEIDVFSSDVFEDANVETTNLILKKEINIFKNKKVVIKFIDNKKTFQNLNSGVTNISYHNYDDWKKSRIFNLNFNPEILQIKEKMNSNKIILEMNYSLTVGIQAYDSYAGQSNEIINNRAYHSTFKENETFR